MFTAILSTQWKWSRWLLLFGVLAAFAVPVLSVEPAGFVVDPGDVPWHAREVLATIERWSLAYPLIACALGLMMALATWMPDHRGRHIYALSLPVPRWRYALLRFGAGAALLAAPVLATLAGALVAVAAAEIPFGMQGHPWALTIRFALSLGVAYALFFAICAGTSRTAGYILGGIAAILATHLLLVAAGTDVDLLGRIAPLLGWPGPFQIFTGRWMLIDV